MSFANIRVGTRTYNGGCIIWCDPKHPRESTAGGGTQFAIGLTSGEIITFPADVSNQLRNAMAQFLLGPTVQVEPAMTAGAGASATTTGGTSPTGGSIRGAGRTPIRRRKATAKTEASTGKT